MKAGRRDQLIAFQTATTSQDDYGEEVLTWSVLCTEWAAVFYGRGDERRQAAMEQGQQAATFQVPSNADTRAVTLEDRIVHLRFVWDIVGISPDVPGRGGIDWEGVIRALNDQLGQFLGKKGVSGEELTRLVSNNVDALPGRFETSGAVLGAMMTSDLYRRPDNYYELLAGKYRALTQAELNAALKAAVDPRGFTWVVVGDAKQVRPQLDKLGIPVEVVQPR